jgi:hypothetical protein
MKKYTTDEITALTGITKTRLTTLKNGRNVKRNGKVEWREPPLLSETDYETVIEKHRLRVYYFESAVEKIRAKNAM